LVEVLVLSLSLSRSNKRIRVRADEKGKKADQTSTQFAAVQE